MAETTESVHLIQTWGEQRREPNDAESVAAPAADSTIAHRGLFLVQVKLGYPWQSSSETLRISNHSDVRCANQSKFIIEFENREE
jgi:hypothetical protein